MFYPDSSFTLSVFIFRHLREWDADKKNDILESRIESNFNVIEITLKGTQ